MKTRRSINFCMSCGEPLPVPGPTVRQFLGDRLLGRRCPGCGVRNGNPDWAIWTGGMIFGLALSVAIGLWQASTPPAVSLPQLAAGGKPPAQPGPASPVSLETNPGVEVAHVGQEPEHLCGAPTKSGKPCRRKVRGTTGYCWQHRK